MIYEYRNTEKTIIAMIDPIENHIVIVEPFMGKIWDDIVSKETIKPFVEPDYAI